MVNILKFLILYLITTIERIEYRFVELDEDDISKKILNTLSVSDTYIDTDTGWEPISSIHKTQPYKIWQLRLKNGLTLEGADNHIVFDENYAEIFIKDLKIGDKILTKHGPSSIISLESSKTSVSMFDVSVDSPNHRYWTNDILSHNTICSAIYITWYLVFNYDRNCMLLSNKGATSKEIMDKVKVIMRHLPFFIKPGVLTKDVMSMYFDNGCKIVGQSTTENSGISFTIHLLFLDEFAHVPKNIASSFYYNVYPTLSSSKISRIIITSTPNGFNLFENIYTAAVEERNLYNPIRTDWWEVPGRDDEWRDKEIAQLGSVEAFNTQYGCDFIASSSLLLSSSEIKKLIESEEEYVFYEIEDLDDAGIDYSMLKWHPGFVNPDEAGNIDIVDYCRNPSKFFVMSDDLAEGVNLDSTVANIFEIALIDEKHWKNINMPDTVLDFIGLRQIGVWRDNKTSIEDFSKIYYNMTTILFDQENIKHVVEHNTYGALFFKHLETVYPESNDFDTESIVRFKHRLNSNKEERGVKLHLENKKYFAKQLKTAVGNGKMRISDKRTIHEAKVFARTNSGGYEAQTGNDDHVMTCVNVAGFFDTNSWSEIALEYFDMLTGDENPSALKIQKIIDVAVPDGSDLGDIYDLDAGNEIVPGQEEDLIDDLFN